MNLLSYISAWWFNDIGDTADENAYRRFMDWMADPETVKSAKAKGWQRYDLAAFYADMALLRQQRRDYKRYEFSAAPNA
jgi:hypothetical protein